MARTFQVKRGAKVKLPTLAQGEFGFVNDAGAEELHIGTGSGNIELARKDYVDRAVGNMDLSGYATEEYVNSQIEKIPTPDVSGQINTHNTSESAHSDIRSAVGAKYTKPTTGIPKSDLADDVKASLGKADSAIQSLEGYATETYVGGQVNNHNVATDAHNDIRNLITELTTRLNALANSDDTTLDQMAEVVAYIKDNRELIEGVTTSKVNISDIIDNLTTNVSNKPLSAAQGVALKGLIDSLTTVVNGKSNFSGNYNDLTNKPTIPTVPTKVSAFENDKGYLTSFTESDPTVPAWAKAASKPSYTYSEVGAAAAGHKHTKSEITDFPTSMPASDVYSWAKASSKPSYSYTEVGAAPASHTHDDRYYTESEVNSMIATMNVLATATVS